MKKLLLPLIASLLLNVPLSAKTIEFPAKDSEFSFTLPKDWTGAFDGNVFTSQPKGANFALSIFPAPAAESVEDVIKITEKSAGSQYTDCKIGEPAEHEVGGIKFTFADGTGKKDGAEWKLTLVGFSPDGEHYVGMFSAGDEAADKKHGAECMELLKSIKLKHGDAKEKDDE